MCIFISNMHMRISPCTDPSLQFLLSAGITYVRRNDLPQGTILFDSQTLNVVDSTFEQLAAFGQASLILTNSNVFFSNVTMNNNYQSQAGAILVNQTSNATIINSVFNNNFGYQAGAISVACESFCRLSSLCSFCGLVFSLATVKIISLLCQHFCCSKGGAAGVACRNQQGFESGS